MKAEIIAVGTELLMGDVINSNAAWISKQLAALGVDVYYHVAVGDNPARIQAVVAQAVERSDLLIFTGGLGPTEDDLTIATLADYFQTPLESDPTSEAAIKDYFKARDLPMSPSNLKQAKKPADAFTIQNPVGTAPGIAWDVSQKAGSERCLLLTFPGVPKELYAMWPQGADWIQAELRKKGEQPEVLVSHHLKFFGIGESRLGEMLSDLMQSSNPTVAPYVGNAEVKIRIAAKGSDTKHAESLMEPVKTEILQRCGKYYFGDDDTTLEGDIGQLLIHAGQSLVVAESCTGGLISSRLTDVSGSRAYTFINLVTYGNQEKTRFLNVKPETLTDYGAVSTEVAAEMVLGAQALSANGWALAITGIAGPTGGSPEKPIGLAYVGIVGPDLPQVIVKKILMNPRFSRADIKYQFSQAALGILLQALKGTLQPDQPAS
jgi:nicotinamide-nucleotide amidase